MVEKLNIDPMTLITNRKDLKVHQITGERKKTLINSLVASVLVTGCTEYTQENITENRPPSFEGKESTLDVSYKSNSSIDLSANDADADQETVHCIVQKDKIVESLLRHDGLLRSIIQWQFWGKKRPDIEQELKYRLLTGGE